MTLSKIIDGTTLKFAIFTIYLVWLNYMIKNFYIAVLLAFLLMIVTILIIDKILVKTKPLFIDKKRIFTKLSLLGSIYTLNLFLKPKNISCDKTYFNLNNTLYYSVFRFSDANFEDVATAYRQALKDNSHKIILLCKNAPRSVQLLASSLPVDFEFATKNDIYNVLKKNNLLPHTDDFKTPKIKTPNIKSIIEITISSANIRYYIFSGALLAIMSFITPFKMYYIIMSSILLILAIICKIYNK